MKRTMMMIAIAALAAGSAFAQEGDGKPKGHTGKMWDREGGGQPFCARMDKRGGDDRSGCPMDPAAREQMRADHLAIRELGDAARAETNDVAKAEIVAKLRAKLGEVADRIQTHRERRLAEIQAQTEKRIAELKAGIEEDKAQRDSRIEKQVQRILSGERPDPSCDFRREKGGKGEWREGERGHGKGEWRKDERGRGDDRHGDDNRRWNKRGDNEDDDEGDDIEAPGDMTPPPPAE